MRDPFLRIVCAIALLPLGTLLAVEVVDTSKLPAPVTRTVDFKKEIKPLLEKSCFGCHGAKPRAKSKYFMNDREKTIQGGSSKMAAIVPGNSTKSPMVHYIGELISELEMPPIDNREKYPEFTREQIALIRGWIDQGVEWPEGVELEMPE